MSVSSVFVGYKYGNLEVTEQCGRVNIGKSSYNLWCCHCALCNRYEKINQYDLVRYKYDRCSVCRRPRCRICGEENISGAYRFVCSESCYLESKRIRNRKSSEKRALEDSDFYKKQWAKKKQRMEENPELKEKRQLQQQKYRELARSDSVKSAQQKAVWEDYYARNREAILKKQAEYRRSRPGDQVEMDNQYNREYYQENKDRIYARVKARFDSMTPEEQKMYRDKANESSMKSARNKKARDELSKLLGVSDELLSMKESTDE